MDYTGRNPNPYYHARNDDQSKDALVIQTKSFVTPAVIFASAIIGVYGVAGWYIASLLGG